MGENNIDYELNRITGTVLRNLRIQKGLSLETLANKMSIKTTRQTLNKYELGKNRIKNKMFISICEALGENPAKVWETICKKSNGTGISDMRTQRISANQFVNEVKDLLSKSDIPEEKKKYLETTLDIIVK